MTQKENRFMRSSNARGFLFFLFLTTIIAVLIKLSKVYTKNYQIPIVISEVPVDISISKINPEFLNLNTQLSGFALLRNSLINPNISIPFDQLEINEDGTYIFETKNISDQLKESLLNIQEFTISSEESIRIEIDQLSNKKIPVKSKISFDYQSGYGPSEPIKFKPDSITIVGPQAALLGIDGIYTTKITNNDVVESIKQKVSLDTIALSSHISFSNLEVQYEQKVTKFTEGSFQIPITLKNVPNRTIKTFPKEVTLYFVSSLDAFNDVLPSDFEVIADFNKTTKNNNFVLLSISKKPANVNKVRLEVKQIKYIVVN